MSVETNKRIFKNSLFLYLRMLFTILVELYTSRVILEVLGVVDYGIYNVVGGFITILAVFNGAMTVATQRYLTFELGRGNELRLKQIFNVCFILFLFVGFVLLVLSETVGLWFVNNKLTIPLNRLNVSYYVYQFAIISSFFSLITNPFISSVIAHERLHIYAYISIFTAMLKLLIALLLGSCGVDKLYMYSFLMMCSVLLSNTVYILYCRKNFNETKFSFFWDKELYSEICKYSGWNIFGNIAAIAKGQGLNVLLNMFFNPAVNAARAISYQVISLLTTFFSNFYNAVRPQITKFYAQNDLKEMFNLMLRSSKFSFYLILLVAMPIMIETPFVITLWLKYQPEYVVSFVRVVVLISIVDNLSNPIMTAIHSTGKIAFYQFVVGSFQILILPVSYIFLKCGYPPISVFFVSLLFSVVSFFARLKILTGMMPFPIREYLFILCPKFILITSLSCILPCLCHFFNVNNSFCISLFNCFLSVISVVVVVYFIGLTVEEKRLILSYMRRFFK